MENRKKKKGVANLFSKVTLTDIKTTTNDPKKQSVCMWTDPPEENLSSCSPVSHRHTDLGYAGDGDGHAVAGVDFVAPHVESQSVQGNPGETHGEAQRGEEDYKNITSAARRRRET